MCRIFLRCLKRITPAWAGKRFVFDCIKFKSQDHPRMGGEKIASWTVCNVSMGSPPHGRGKAPALQPWRLSPGITPAWAGKSIQSGGPLYPAWDHPRMGGEKPTTGGAPVEFQGSPPHGRGKVTWRNHSSLILRITPAWAGKRSGVLYRLSLNRDHPRMGGEKFHKSVLFQFHLGSPPHGRGKD